MRALLCVQARIGAHLVIAAATRVQTRAGVADVLDQFALDGHMDVFVIDVENEFSLINSLLDIIQAGMDFLFVLLADNALRGKHGRMRLGTGNILRIKRLVDGKRCAKTLSELAHTLFETT